MKFTASALQCEAAMQMSPSFSRSSSSARMTMRPARKSSIPARTRDMTSSVVGAASASSRSLSLIRFRLRVAT